MGVVNTSYTFTATDTITSAKMNNIIDDTIMTSTAISGTTLQVTPSGQLAVNSQGITSNELAASSVTQTKIGTNVAGSGPAFRAWSSNATAVASGSYTKLLFDSESYDTNGNFSSSRFTPTIAGYYLITAQVSWPSGPTNGVLAIYKNNTVATEGSESAVSTIRNNIIDIIYMNGSSDYIEIYGRQNSGSARATSNLEKDTFVSGCLIRSA